MKNYWLDRKQQQVGVIVCGDGYFDLSLVSSSGRCANCGSTTPHSCVPQIETGPVFTTDTIGPVLTTDTIPPAIQIDVTPIKLDTVWGTMDVTTQPIFVSWEPVTSLSWDSILGSCNG